LCLLCTIIAFTFLVAAIFMLIKVISLHKYDVIEPSYFLRSNYFSELENIIAYRISIAYLDAIEINRDVNESRMQRYQKAITNVIIAIIVLIATYIIKYNFM
jgi:hypothetical protein